MNKLKYIIPIGFLLFGACTSPEEVAVPDSEDSSVQFRVTVGEGENALYESEYFKEGDEKRNTLTEFNSNNTRILNVQQTKEKIASLQYIQQELKNMQQ